MSGRSIRYCSSSGQTGEAARPVEGGAAGMGADGLGPNGRRKGAAGTASAVRGCSPDKGLVAHSHPCRLRDRSKWLRDVRCLGVSL